MQPDQCHLIFTEDQVDAALDAWFTDPNWREVFANHPVRKFMNEALIAAANAAPTPPSRSDSAKAISTMRKALADKDQKQMTEETSNANAFDDLLVKESSDATSRHEKDNCQLCLGSKGGVKGNENVIHGLIVCDYCHAELMDALNKERTADLAEYIAKGMSIAGDIAEVHTRSNGNAARQVYAKGRLDCAVEITSAIQTEAARRAAEATGPHNEGLPDSGLKFDDDFLADLYLDKLPIDKRNEIARHYLGETPNAEIAYLKGELDRVATQLRLERSLTSHSNTALRDLSVLLHEQEEWPEAEGLVRKASHDLTFANQRNRALSEAIECLLKVNRTRYSQAISICSVDWDNLVANKIKPALEMQPSIGADQPLPEWGNFRDPAKPDRWCVRLKGSIRPGCEFHVATEDEANELVAALSAQSLCA